MNSNLTQFHSRKADFSKEFLKDETLSLVLTPGLFLSE